MWRASASSVLDSKATAPRMASITESAPSGPLRARVIGRSNRGLNFLRARLREALEVEFAQAVLDPFPDSEEVDTGAAGATAPAA